LPDATSIRQLAKEIGRGESTTRRLLKHKRWPVSREGPWSEDDIHAVRLWLPTLQPNRADKDRVGRSGAEPPPEEQTKDYWLMRKYRAQAREAEGELVAVSEVVSDGVRWASEVRGALLLVAPAAASLCVGKGVEDIERAIDEHIRSALDGVASLMDSTASASPPVGWDGEGDTDAPAAEAE
jgi:hypothetical protein